MEQWRYDHCPEYGRGLMAPGLGVVNTWWSCGENMLWSYGYLEIRWWYVAISSETVGVNFDLVDFFFFYVSQRIIFCYINLNENLSFVDNCIRGSNGKLIKNVAYWPWAIDSNNIDTQSGYVLFSIQINYDQRKT